MVGVPFTPRRSPNSNSSLTGLAQVAALTVAPVMASLNAFLRSELHQTETALVYEGVSLPAVVLMPSRGQNTYSTAMPCLLNSSMWACSWRQKPQSTSVNTVTVCFGLAGE